ncbi:MAG: nuclear transport factor 2 family protein [Williamsia sp.]|nr:nuclear transport factor 2 family protein [Williamsia sp.]
MIKKITPFLVLICITCTLHAQSKDEQAVATAVEALRKAMVDGDSVQLDKITDKELTYGHSGGNVQSKAAFIRSFTSGQSDFVTIDLSAQTIQVYGNTAVVRHTLSANTNDGGKPGSVKIAVMTVWQKQKKDWKLIARQAVKLT